MLAHRVDSLASEFPEIKVLILNLQPPSTPAAIAVEPPAESQHDEDVISISSLFSAATQYSKDVLSTRASCNLF